MKVAILIVTFAALATCTDATIVKMDFLPVGHVRTDPIISQTCLTDHVHTFYGPQVVRPETDFDDLMASTVAQNTGNVEENKSLYWHPTVYKYDRSSEIYTRDEISQTSAYYIWDNDNHNTQAFPAGFRMIAGMKGNSGGEFPNAFAECVNPSPCEGDCYTENTFFPSTACDELEVSMAFPTCWDGRLDSDDHMSHVHYTTDGEFDGECPQSHPQRLPQIQFFFRIAPYDGGWHTFSDGSSTYHADYMSGWDENFLQNLLDNCNTGAFMGDPNAFCEDFLTFRDAPKCADASCDFSDPALLEKIKAFQPPPLDVTTITPEDTDVISNLPRGTCTGTLLPPDGSPTAPTAPVSTPTAAPVAAPTGGACVDQELAFKNKSKQNCSWVAKNTKRCDKDWKGQKLSDYCPVACGSCDDAPVSTPTAAPVAAPTGGACVDQELAYKNKPKQNCSWVGKNTKRCDKVWKGQKLSGYCPVACGSCDNAPVSSPTAAPVTAPSGNEPTGGACVDQQLAYKNKSKWDCVWVAQKAEKRCNKPWKGMQLSEYCPKSCNIDC